MAGLTAECWVKFREQAAGDLVCRTAQVMIRVREKVDAYFWIDGAWRIVPGSKPVPVGRWTHLAITWDQAAKMASVYVDGELDVAQEPDGISEAKLGAGQGSMRLGGHTWQANPIALNGQLDEVRISSVARQYQAPHAKAAGAGAPAAVTQDAAAEQPLKPWATNTDATDVPKSKVQEITRAEQKYTVLQGGTMDGRNCRSPMGCGMSREGAFYQTWESNRSVRMENVGQTRRRQPLAFQRPQQFPERGRDRPLGPRAGDERWRKRPLRSGSRRSGTATIPAATTASWATP